MSSQIFAWQQSQRPKNRHRPRPQDRAKSSCLRKRERERIQCITEVQMNFLWNHGLFIQNYPDRFCVFEVRNFKVSAMTPTFFCLSWTWNWLAQSGFPFQNVSDNKSYAYKIYISSILRTFNTISFISTLTIVYTYLYCVWVCEAHGMENLWNHFLDFGLLFHNYGNFCSAREIEMKSNYR